jgi:hypothetical protein
MGILTDYFVAASDAEAAGFLDGGVHGQGLPSDHVLECKGVDPYVALGTLEAILAGPPDTGTTTEGTTVVFSMETGAVVARVRPRLLHALVSANEEHLHGVADRWSRTEEVATEDPAPIRSFLGDLADLARTADAEDAGVYCWASP